MDIPQLQLVETKAEKQSSEYKWYHFTQNNSGGYYSKPAKDILIELRDEEKGLAKLVLNCLLDIDYDFCECCGERWNFDGGTEYDTLDEFWECSKGFASLKRGKTENIPFLIVIDKNKTIETYDIAERING